MDLATVSSEDFSRLLHNDLYGTYSDLRRLNSPLRVYFSGGEINSSALFFSSYEHAKRILADDSCISKDFSASTGTSVLTTDNTFSESMLFRDNPEHKFLKSLFSDYFKRVPISTYWDVSKNESDLLLRKALEVKGSDQVDFIKDFAGKLPLCVILNVLGFPNEKIIEIASLSEIINRGADTFSPLTVAKEEKNEAVQKCFDLLFHAALGEWQAEKDALFEQVQGFVATRAISPEVAAANLLLLLFAGHETTIALLGNLFYCLASSPDQLQKLVQDSSLIDSAVDEALRFESPLQRSTFRVATKAFTLDGLKIDEGEEIYVLIGAANRDEHVFPDSSIFDLSRRPNSHLSFGKGSHHCLGRHLSLLEAKASLDSFFSCFPSMENMHICSSHWNASTFVRHLDFLTLGFD